MDFPLRKKRWKNEDEARATCSTQRRSIHVVTTSKCLNNPNLNLHLKTLPLRLIRWLLSNEEERLRERDRGCIAEYVDEIIDLLQAMGTSDALPHCNVEEFISPLEEDQENVIMTLHWVTNAKAILILSLDIGRWKKC